MLKGINALDGFKIHAEDGEIGKLEDVYFDDEKWTVRYFVLRTGSWLFGKEVLLSPISLKRIDWHAHEIIVKLTMEQVKKSPSVETEKPISKQQEYEFSRYFGFPVYWGGAGFWGDAMHPGALYVPPEELAEEDEEKKKEYDHHLRSVREVCGYRIHAQDGEIGHVEDFILDDEKWVIRYMEVHTRGLLHGKKVILSPKWIEKVDWAQAEVCVGLKKEIIKNAPEFDPTKPIDRDYEEKLFDYYGTVKYWLEEQEEE